jgi:two-component system, OmpR family, osmolarity sensor histidine kinase EnvZ
MLRPFESGNADGTGLGLAIARDIIAAHGADMRLDDSPLGGLRVVITIPT